MSYIYDNINSLFDKWVRHERDVSRKQVSLPCSSLCQNWSYYQVVRGCVCMHVGRGLLLKIAGYINGKSQ